jgi:hypothetical protein
LLLRSRIIGAGREKNMPHFESEEDFFNALDSGPEAFPQRRKMRKPASSEENAAPQDDDSIDCDPDEEP